VAVRASSFNQLAMASLRKGELEWHPDTDLLMSKLHQIEEERSADGIQSYLRKLASILKLHCCCLESGLGKPDMPETIRMESAFDKPDMPEMIHLDFATCAESQTNPLNGGAATAPDHSDENNIPTLSLNYPSMTHNVGLADTSPKPKQPPPPTVFTHNQTPCNSPRTLMRKQNELLRKHGDKSSIHQESASQLGARISKPKPGIQQFGWRNLLKRRVRPDAVGT